MTGEAALGLEVDVRLDDQAVEVLRHALVSYQAAATRLRLEGAITDAEHAERVDAADDVSRRLASAQGRSA